MGEEARAMSEPLFDIITIGDMCVDLLVDVGDVPIRFGQAEQWIPGYTLEMGGSADIFACQAARLGMRVGILGCVGEDAYGELVVGRLEECGVDTRFVRRDPEYKTGLGLTLCRPNADRAILTYGGSLNAVYPGDVTDAFLRSGRHLHYGSYYLQTHLLPVVPDILRRARALGLTVSLDTNWDPEERWDGRLAEALTLTDVFMPNDQEALAIAGTDSMDEALDRLLTQTPRVAVKCGVDGALVACDGVRLAVPTEPAPHIADTVGAGDCFDAGFVVGWLRGLDPARCAAIGNACARATLATAGGVAGQLRAEDIEWVKGGEP